MKKNLGSADRWIRVTIAAVLIALYFTHTVTGLLATVLIILALVFLLTSMLGFCPLYLPFGVNTIRKKIMNHNS